MNGSFTGAHGGAARLRIGSEEAAVIRLLIGQLLDLIGGDDEPKPFEGLPDLAISDNTSVPDDPVLARLFPDAYRDDQDASAEFRRYTEASLRDGKRAAAETVLETLGDGGEILLDAEQSQAWLRSLNDLRLALGIRLDITEETLDQMRDFDWEDPRNAGYAAYDWLTYLQESLVRAVTLLPMLTIERAIVDKIVAHARADHPDEACGVVAGAIGSDRPTRFIPMMNAERSPTFYRFDSKEQFTVWREMDERDEEPVVIYHSHTATEAYPSRTDISYASEPNAHYVLVSTREPDETEFRSYRIAGDEVTEEEITVVETDPGPAR